MKLDCGESWPVKKERLKNWHRWYAWFPIQVGNHDCRWLEWIERKGDHACYGGDWFWEYRA